MGDNPYSSINSCSRKSLRDLVLERQVPYKYRNSSGHELKFCFFSMKSLREMENQWDVKRVFRGYNPAWLRWNKIPRGL